MSSRHHVIIHTTYQRKFTIQWYQNNVTMFWCPLREICLHSRLVWALLLHILSEYADLLCNSPYPFQMRERIRTSKSCEHGHFPHRDQVLWFISLNLFFCLHLEITSFFWFRRLFPWCSMIKRFSFKHK